MQVSFAGFFNRFHVRPQHVVLGVFSLLVIGLAASSLVWRIDGDLAWNLYVARLVDQRGFVPYRDIYVIDSPGTIFVSIIIGRLTGYTSDLGPRVVDLALLAALSALSWAWLRRFGGLVAWGGVVLFDLVYLESGQAMALQKEYLMLLPLAGAMLIATAAPRLPGKPGLDDRLRGFLIGLLFGIIAVIKPHGALALPVILVFMLLEIRARDGALTARQAVGYVLCGAAGAALPVLAAAVYLIANRALAAYLDILVHYGALYGQTTYQLTVVSGPGRLDYLYSTLATLNGRQVWLLPAAVGVMVFFLPGAADDRLRRQAGLILALAGCYLVYPALTGQFYVYHWLPFVYFLLALAALCLAPVPWTVGRWTRAIPLAALALVLVLRYDMVTSAFSTMNTRLVAGRLPVPPAYGRSDQIAAYARANFAPGETAQPLDWGNGAMLGLLLADVPPANRFVFDALFFYDARGAYVQGLRREFIDSLRGAHPPDWIVYISAQPTLQGPGIGYNWPEIRKTLDTVYQPRYVGRDTVIYHRADGVARGVIAYPKPDYHIQEDFVKIPDDVLWISQAQAEQPDTLAAKLASFSARYEFISLDMTPLEADPGPLQAWLSQNAFYLGEQPVANTVVTDYVNCKLPGSEYPEATATFGDAISLQSASVNWAENGPQRTLCATLVWKALKPVGQSYHVALHITGPDGKVIAQHDGIPMAGLAPSNTWTPGQPVADRFAIPLPVELPPGEYRMSVVVYTQDTGQRLPVAGGDSYPIGTFRMGGI